MVNENRIKVWDPLVRAFHWTLVAAFGIAYVTEEDFLSLHSWAGYTVFALLMVRLVWGFIGTRYARFSNFIYSPREIRHFLKQTMQLRGKRYIGHNPAGGAMIVLLILSLLITTVTGMAVYGISDNAGPLANWLSHSSHATEKMFEEVHEFFANFTLFLVFVHVAGVVVESVLHRENLVRAMFSGYKRASHQELVEEKQS